MRSRKAGLHELKHALDVDLGIDQVLDDILRSEQSTFFSSVPAFVLMEQRKANLSSTSTSTGETERIGKRTESITNWNSTGTLGVNPDSTSALKANTNNQDISKPYSTHHQAILDTSS